MPLAESPALHVLPRQANGDAVFENRSQRQLFRHRPVDASVIQIIQRMAPPVPGALELTVDREALGQCQKRFVQLPQPLDGDCRSRLARRARRRRFGHRLDQLTLGFEGFVYALDVVGLLADEAFRKTFFDDSALE